MSGTVSAGRKLTGALGAVATLNLAAAAAAHVVVLARIGANSVGDAYFASLILPQLLTGVVFGAILNSTVPYLTTRGSRRRRDAWSLLVGVLGVGVVITVVIGLAAPVLVPIVAPGFDSATRELTTRLLRIGLVGALAACGTAVATAWYHARDRFILPESLGLLGNGVFLIGAVVLVDVGSVETAAWLNVASYALPLAMLAMPLALGAGRAAPVPALRRLALRAHPLAGLGVLQQVEPALERALVSLGPPGGVALYALARQLLTGGLLVLDKAVAAPVLPALSREGPSLAFRARLRRAQRNATGLAAAAVVAAAVAGPLLIPGLSDRTTLSEGDLVAMWHLVLLFGGGLVFGALFNVTTKGCYALGNRVTPTRLAAVAFAIGVCLRVGGYVVAGAAGIAIAVSIQWAGLAVALGRVTKWGVSALGTDAPRAGGAELPGDE